MNTPHPIGDQSPATSTRQRVSRQISGYAKLSGSAALAFFVTFNLTAVSASMSPLLGMLTLVVTLLVTFAVLDRLGQRWAPAAVRGFDMWCRTTARNIRRC